jgi:hypothetical protein
MKENPIIPRWRAKKAVPKSVFLAQPLSKVDYLVKKGM